MERECVERLAGEVAIVKRLAGFDRVLGGIVLGVDVVGDDALRKRAGHLGREGALGRYESRTQQRGNAQPKDESSHRSAPPGVAKEFWAARKCTLFSQGVVTMA